MEDVNNEDLFVVIVGYEDDAWDSNSKDQVLDIKQEVLDEDTEEIAIEELIETAEKYGEPVELGYLKREHGEPFELGYLKKEPIDEYGPELIDEYGPEAELIDDDNVDDEDYIQDFSDEDSDEGYHERKKIKLNSTRPKRNQRYKMRTLEEQESFVDELRQQHPELAEDQELLIDTLTRIMLDIKRPTPPKDFFIMNNIMFECVQCGAIKQTMPAVSRHWQEKHGSRYLICFACGVDFRSTTNLYKHEKRCNARDAVIVLKARARTLGRKGRGRPFLVSKATIRKLQLKAKKRFPCSYCSADFSCKPALQSHEFKHTGARPFRCDLCPAAYTSALGLKRHSRKHTNILFICDHCQRPFKCRSALIVHLDTHKPLRKFLCTECGKRFAQKMALQLHVDRVHRRLPPPCACQMCPKRYPRMSLLKKHMLREHGMNLITRKMFYKSLPMLTETQLQQAKVVLKSELDPSRDPNATNDDTQDDSQGNLTEELMQYVRNMHMQRGQRDADTKYIVMHNGEAISVDGSKIDFYKSNLISEVEEELEHHLEFEVVEDSTNEMVKTEETLYESDETNGQEEILCESSGIVLVRQSDDANTKQRTKSDNVSNILSRKGRKKKYN